MKTGIKISPGASHFRMIILFPLIFIAFLCDAQILRDVIPGYKGWEGNPDSLTVFIDSSFSAAEKDSVRVGMQRWNAAGGVPKFKEVSSKPANVTVREGNPGAGNAGVYKWKKDPVTGKVTEGEIIIGNNPNPGLRETATHELGHALGCDDCDEAKNPSDVMKGSGPSNGSDGNLSKHDSTELAAAIKSITVPAPAPAGEEPLKKRAIAPATSILPDIIQNVDFDLGIPFPPGSVPIGLPVGTIDVEIVSMNLVGHMLNTQVIVGSQHGFGQFYLDITIQPPLPDLPVKFLGYHFVSPDPIDPLTFQCPCEIYEEGGMVHVDWKEHHNYPDPTTDLRAHLEVDGEDNFVTRGGSNFVIELPEGHHVFTLRVDDHEVNSCTFTATYEVQGSPVVPLHIWAVVIGLFLILGLTIARIRARWL